jgi:hypothetical protein
MEISVVRWGSMGSTTCAFTDFVLIVRHIPKCIADNAQATVEEHLSNVNP